MKGSRPSTPRTYCDHSNVFDQFMEWDKRYICDECGETITCHQPRYGETVMSPLHAIPVLQHDIWAERRFCSPCWWCDFVHVDEYGLGGFLYTRTMLPRVQILPGYLERSWETGTIFRTIMCAEGDGYRNKQTGLEIITMQKVKMRTC